MPAARARDMKLEIRHYAGFTGQVYCGPKTKEEVLEIVTKFLSNPEEGHEIRFEWAREDTMP